MILYPTETIYALGANAFDKTELETLYEVKGRDSNKAVSVLVRDISDIKNYAVLSPLGEKIAKAFLPGSLTLVLPISDKVPKTLAGNGTLGFRVSTDTFANKLIAEFMNQYDAPLTCTSANLSSLPTLPSVSEILLQLSEKSSLITKVIDGGERKGIASTVVRIIDDEIEILRVGAVSEETIKEVL